MAADWFEDGLTADNSGACATALRLWQPLAGQGIADDLGNIYCNGHGVPQGYVQARMWWNVAAVGGDKDSTAARDFVAAKMALGQIAEAQMLARKWKPKPAVQ